MNLLLQLILAVYSPLLSFASFFGILEFLIFLGQRVGYDLVLNRASCID
jgi:hypothetical protein